MSQISYTTRLTVPPSGVVMAAVGEQFCDYEPNAQPVASPVVNTAPA